MSSADQIKALAGKIDHAVLGPGDGDIDVIRACEVARKYETASVCVKPCHVLLAVEELANTGIAVGTVVGFPHGGTTTGIKYGETVEALRNGAREIDMVINIGKLKDENLTYVQNEIEFISRFVHDAKGILKMIIETSLLNEKQKMLACKVAEAGGADYVKTSTGFSGGGATIEDIKFLKSVLGTNMKVKASGGIKTFEHAIAFVDLGCDRIGTSRTESILSNHEGHGEY